MPAEIELKLAISASDVPKLARIPSLISASRGRATTSRLYSIYYDTPELTLRGQGVALRLRKIGATLAANAEDRRTRRGRLAPA